MVSKKMGYVGLMVVLLVMPGLHAFSFRDLKDPASLQHLKEEIFTKHPDLVKWFERASSRLNSGASATKEDLDEVKNQLIGARQQIQNFVSSPQFVLVTTMFIDEFVRTIKPLLGVMPLKEVKGFYNIVAKDPKLMEVVFDSEEDIADIMPGGKNLKKWASDKAEHIVEDSMKHFE